MKLSPLDENQWLLTISTDTYIKNLYIYTETGIQLDKNFIDLLPREVYTIKINASTPLQLQDLKVLALNDLIKG